MAQYWLQTPIENAKEVVQRFIDDNVGSLPGLAGKTVGYLETTEVIHYANLIDQYPHSNDEIYFGTWYLTSSDSSLDCGVFDGTSILTTFSPMTVTVDGGQYPYIIWNICTGLPTLPSYFVGYKFSLL